jgi:hypothetical protein
LFNSGTYQRKTLSLAMHYSAKRYHLLPINFNLDAYISVPPAVSFFELRIDGVPYQTLKAGDPVRILDPASQTLNGVWVQCFCEFPDQNGRPLPLELLHQEANREALAANYTVNANRRRQEGHSRFVYCSYMPCNPKRSGSLRAAIAVQRGPVPHPRPQVGIRSIRSLITNDYERLPPDSSFPG